MTDKFASKTEEVPRDTWGRYRLYDPTDPEKTVKSWTRVTTFAKAIDDQTNLQKWLMRMTAKGLVEDDALIIKTQETDLDNRKTLDRICEKAKEKAGANVAAERGTAIHTLTERIDRGESPRVPSKWKKHLQGYQRIRDNSGLEVVPEYIERVVVVPKLGVAGTFDRLCRVKRDMQVVVDHKEFNLRKGEYVVGDVKTSRSLDYSQLSFAVQLAVYSRADFVYDLKKQSYDHLPRINPDVGFIFHIPSDTGDASLYAIDLERGWEAAGVCKIVRDMRGYRNLVKEVPVLSQNPFESDSDLDWETRIQNASSRAELSQIWKEANSLGSWTPELESLGRKRLGAL